MHWGKAHLIDSVVGMKASFSQVASLLENPKAKISVVKGRCQVLGKGWRHVCTEEWESEEGNRLKCYV